MTTELLVFPEQYGKNQFTTNLKLPLEGLTTHAANALVMLDAAFAALAARVASLETTAQILKNEAAGVSVVA